MSDSVYCYPPDHTVLKNRLNLRDASELAFFEREFVMQRIAEGVPDGDFSLSHLRAIHRHLFQDVYDWAGSVRSIEIAKGATRFMPLRYIASGMADIHRRLSGQGFLVGTDPAHFAQEAGIILGDLNHVHPFREGNGRTQLLYLEQLAIRAGHRIDLTGIGRADWMAASRDSHFGEYASMQRCIARAMGSDLGD